MLLGRQDRVSKPAFVFDLLATPSFQSFIDYQEQWRPNRQEDQNDQAQQDLAHYPR
jgi:hypothetical protein